MLEARAISACHRSVIIIAACQTACLPATAQAQELLKSMLLKKFQFATLNFMFLVAAITAAGFTGQERVCQAGKPDLRPAGAPDDVSPKPGPGRMFVTGRVLDPLGKPVPDASVMVYARSIAFQMAAAPERRYSQELGRGASDSSGRFRIDLPRVSSSRHDEFGAVALAPGFGIGWVDALDPDAEQPTADITLRPEQVIHGRLFDLQCQPARDVKLSVTAVRKFVPNARNSLRENFEGPAFWWTHPDDLAGWPSPAITGAEGGFTLHGVGPGLRIFLSVIDPRFNGQVADINTETAAATKPLTFALQPVRTIIGQVTYADTGKPVPHARVLATGFDQFHAGVGARPIVTSADAEGRFRAHTGSGARGVLTVFPPDGHPYLSSIKAIDWPKGAVTYSADLAVPRAMMLRGKVTEHGSGRPVADAIVGFSLHRTANDDAFARASGPAQTAADGSFTLAVPARRGSLITRAFGDEYVLQAFDSGLIFNGQPGGRRVYAHAFVAVDPKSGSASEGVNDGQIALRRGVAVKGTVLGPDGQPVPDAWMLSRIHLTRNAPLFQIWTGDQHGIARYGQFELHGLDTDSDVPVCFFEPRRKLGATIRFSGKSAGGKPIAVKLEPCATASANLVGADGKPRAEFTSRALISMIVTPGEFIEVMPRKEGTLLADENLVTSIDPINYPKDPATDAQGRIVFPSLIPGATYRIVDRTRNPNGPQLRKEFSVKAGETLDLGDIVIGTPKLRDPKICST
jgi:hypothetical protein